MVTNFAKLFGYSKESKEYECNYEACTDFSNGEIRESEFTEYSYLDGLPYRTGRCC